MTDIDIDQMTLEQTREAARELLDSATGDLSGRTRNASGAHRARRPVDGSSETPKPAATLCAASSRGGAGDHGLDAHHPGDDTAVNGPGWPPAA